MTITRRSLSKPRWSDQDHIFCPFNVARMEEIEGRTMHITNNVRRKSKKPRAPRHGKVVWIMKNGEFV